MGLLVILAILAVPLVLVLLVTKGRGRVPTCVSREELRPQIDGALGRTESDLAKLTDTPGQKEP